MERDDLNILIGGEAGQGLVTLGQLLSKALVRSGYEILVTQGYQSRIRGGHNTFSVRICAEKVMAPKKGVDVLVALNAETVMLHQADLSARGVLVADTGIGCSKGACLNVPFEELAPRRLENTVGLGTLGALLGLDEALLAGMVAELFGKKHPESADANKEALTRAYAWTAARRPEFFFPLRTPAGGTRRMLLNGNEAIALGALAAGVKFCAFYPMTPSTSVPLTLISHADAMGCVVEQAEDEIAAINMALGASFAGAPSMVATSGGGFALMAEGVSLAGMTETPVVIVVAQRPGPATGLPTRTEQGDLDFVLHAGHGEFPRAVFAPGSIESCFELTGKAFQLAEASQGPVFLLTDQFLADCYRGIPPLDLNRVSPVVTGVREEASIHPPYGRYAVTQDGVSPRLIPGATSHLVVADSDEHTEDGHITEDLSVRRIMVEKRLRKMRIIVEETIPPALEGDPDPQLLLVCWGSTLGAAAEAASMLRRRGKTAATLHFEQIWPLVPDHFLHHLESAGQVVCVEGNATGQFAGLVRRETGFHMTRRVLRFDGLPFTADFILERIPEMEA